MSFMDDLAFQIPAYVIYLLVVGVYCYRTAINRQDWRMLWIVFPLAALLGYLMIFTDIGDDIW